MSEADEQTIQDAIKNIERRKNQKKKKGKSEKKGKKVRAKIVQGGSTGLVQQSIKSYPAKEKKVGIIKEIKETLKSQYKCELVLIQVGYYIEVIEEDAKYFKDEFGFKIHDGGGTRPYDTTGCPKEAFLKKYQKLLDEGKVCYCLVEQVDAEEKKVTRKVTYSACDEKALGLTFINKIS